MKLKYLFVAILAFAALFLSACQKDFTPIDNVVSVDSTNNPTSGDSVYLDQFIIRDTNIVTGFIDSSKWTFNYDSQKRLSLITFKSLFNLSDSGNLYKFYYNLNDTLPYQIDGHTPIVGNIEKYYFFYNNSGKLIKDSINNFLGNGENLSRNLLYSGNKMITELNSSNSTSNPIEKDTFTFDSRMNIVDFKYYIRTTLNTFELASSSKSIFDNGISPFVNVPSMKILWFTFSTIDFETTNSLCPGANNILSNIRYRYPYTGSTIMLPYSDTSSHWNTYYQNGLLKNTNSSDHENWTYIYKSL